MSRISSSGFSSVHMLTFHLHGFVCTIVGCIWGPREREGRGLGGGVTLEGEAALLGLGLSESCDKKKTGLEVSGSVSGLAALLRCRGDFLK